TTFSTNSGHSSAALTADQAPPLVPTRETFPISRCRTRAAACRPHSIQSAGGNSSTLSALPFPKKSIKKNVAVCLIERQNELEHFGRRGISVQKKNRFPLSHFSIINFLSMVYKIRHP